VPSTAETTALVGAAELALLPPRAVLVNVAQPVERAILLAPPPTTLTCCGGLSRLLAALRTWLATLHRPGSDRGLRCGREAEVADSAAFST